MKVNLYKTVEVSDEDRRAIARHIDGKGAKKRIATRDEIKEYVWGHGENWKDFLYGEVEAAQTAEEAPEADEDLLGTPAEDEAEEDLLGATGEPSDEDLLGTEVADEEDLL